MADQSKPGNYFVVEFVDGIQLVPHNWMVEKNMKAYWPNFTNNARYDKAVKEKEPPQNTWQLFPIIKVLAKAQTYEKGKQKLKEAEEFSEVNNSEIDEIKSRQRRRKRTRVAVSSSEESDGADDMSQYKLGCFPAPPTSGSQKAKAKASEKEDTMLDSHLKLASNSGSSYSILNKGEMPISNRSDRLDVLPEVPYSPGCSFSRLQNSPKRQKNVLPVPEVRTPSRRSRYEETQGDASPTTSIMMNTDFRNYQRFVIRSLTALKMKVNSISEAIEEIAEKQNLATCTAANMINSDSDASGPRTDILKRFPLIDLVAVEDVEKELIEEKFKRNLIAELAKIGGADIKARATKLMKRLFTNCVAEKFSWIGGKKKLIFSNLLLCGVILDVVRIPMPKATNEEIAVPIKNWLRHAKERLDREKMRTALAEKVVNDDENSNDSD